MKATGIVRRIDDLGRVVVPKEIRRTLRIREGDPLEIYTDREGGIILRKYSPIGELSQFSKQYAEALAQNTGYIVSITDRDQHIAVAGAGKKDLAKKAISRHGIVYIPPNAITLGIIWLQGISSLTIRITYTFNQLIVVDWIT